MDALHIHPLTRAQLLGVQHNMPHALLLLGRNGIGKYTLATTLAGGHDTLVIEPNDKNTISVADVRTLYADTKGRRTTRLFVIIDHAEAMGAEAQNAFLKLLEEPPLNVTFILTAPHKSALIDTIISRVHTIIVAPIANEVLIKFAQSITTSVSAQELKQALFIADGRPAFLYRMLTDAKALASNIALMQRAKQLLSASPYERLAQINELCKDKQALINILEAAMYMVRLHVIKQPSLRLVRQADALQECLQRITSNGNARAQLTYLFTTY